MQKFNEWGMHETFNEQNFDELIVGFIGGTLRGKVSSEKFDESLAIRQSFPPLNFVPYSNCVSHSTIVFIWTVNNIM